MTLSPGWLEEAPIPLGARARELERRPDQRHPLFLPHERGSVAGVAAFRGTVARTATRCGAYNTQYHLTHRTPVGLSITLPTTLESSSLKPGAPDPVPCITIFTVVTYWSAAADRSKDCHPSTSVLSKPCGNFWGSGEERKSKSGTEGPCFFCCVSSCHKHWKKPRAKEWWRSCVPRPRDEEAYGKGKPRLGRKRAGLARQYTP